MQIIAILTPTATTTPAELERLIVPEERVVWSQYAAGRLRQMFFQPEPTRVVLFFEAPDKQTVEGWLSEFPMIAAKLLDVDLIAAGPWLPIAALFAGTHDLDASES
jgi:muconolactone delta-isomerase